jgi:hypothetical protein
MIESNEKHIKANGITNKVMYFPLPEGLKLVNQPYTLKYPLVQFSSGLVIPI